MAEFEDDLSRTIVDCEVNSSAWTLMHRYNKATELIDSVLNVSETAMAWLSSPHAYQNSVQPGQLVPRRVWQTYCAFMLITCCRFLIIHMFDAVCILA